jgi:hypothetical protein
MTSSKRDHLKQEVMVVEVVVVVVSVSVVVVMVKVVQRRKGETERNPNMAELRPRLRGTTAKA